MTRRDDAPRGVSPLVFAAALALGASLLLPTFTSGAEGTAAPACPPAAAAARR